jgi:hypothetical protein
MYLLIAFLSKVDRINDLVHKMKEQGFTGATFSDGAGMSRVLPKVFDMPLVASLHSIFEEDGKVSKVIFCVLENEEEVKKLAALIEDIVGDLNEPDTGLVVAHKLDFVKGYNRWKEDY